MTLALLLGFIIMMGIAATKASQAAHRGHELKKLKEAKALPVPSPPPIPDLALPTRNERWIMESEHEMLPNQTFPMHRNCRVCGPGPLKKNEVPSIYDHPFYNKIQFYSGYGWSDTYRKVSTAQEAQVVSSQIEGSEYHTIMLDIDLPCRVVESSTPGHFHLYIDKPMLWPEYHAILKALLKAGVIEQGFYDTSKDRKMTHLRPPWVEKNTGETY